jgi:hypothetical protein
MQVLECQQPAAKITINNGFIYCSKLQKTVKITR